MTVELADAAGTHNRHGFLIGGRPRILLCGTVSYFRLAREDWEPRLCLFRDSGFNTVDVYVPWNYHELTEGCFDFTTGNRDLSAYLRLCHDLGLMVYFRPGPYICNEWDGGGLPAWLFVKPEVRLRQADAPFLHYVHRYLRRVNDIVRPLLSTNGGPVILYALENELDYFPCEDPAAYLTALRDQARSEGINVPLTACIGDRVKVRQATGCVDDVLPSPNIYVGGLIEKEAMTARTTVAASHFLSGKSMADVPPFVTEMGRDENSLRRILSVGFKGLGPFNFAGGSHFGQWNAVNNWAGLSPVTTSIDFEGMIGYDGQPQPAFGGAARLAGLINAFEGPLALADSVTSWEEGPFCDNARLGAREDEARPGRIYSLVGDEGTFVFLVNTTTEAQKTRVTVGDLTFPRHSLLRVPPNTTPIALAGQSLRHFGLPATLLYSTAEPSHLTSTDGGAELILCGADGGEAELCLASKETLHLVTGDARCFFDRPDRLTLVFPAAVPQQLRVAVGAQTLILNIMTREAAGTETGALPPPTALRDLLVQEWQEAQPASRTVTAQWRGEGRPLEALGVLRGAGWYEVAFESASEAPSLTLPGASDLLTVLLDGGYLGSWFGDGGPLEVRPPTPLASGRHTLRVRAEIWGHSNFHDPRWPSAVLGSLRGVIGPLVIDGEPCDAQWRFATEPSGRTGAVIGAVSSLAAGPGNERIFRTDLTGLCAAGSRGAVLTLEGEDCHGDLRVNDRPVGRFLFGPTLSVRLVGGPANRFYVPPSLLCGDSTLEISLRGVGQGGRLTIVTLEPR